jgi:hypothetical protein
MRRFVPSLRRPEHANLGNRRSFIRYVRKNGNAAGISEDILSWIEGLGICQDLTQRIPLSPGLLASVSLEVDNVLACWYAEEYEERLPLSESPPRP